MVVVGRCTMSSMDDDKDPSFCHSNHEDMVCSHDDRSKRHDHQNHSHIHQPYQWPLTLLVMQMVYTDDDDANQIQPNVALHVFQLLLNSLEVCLDLFFQIRGLFSFLYQ